VRPTNSLPHISKIKNSLSCFSTSLHFFLRRGAKTHEERVKKFYLRFVHLTFLLVPCNFLLCITICIVCFTRYFLSLPSVFFFSVFKPSTSLTETFSLRVSLNQVSEGCNCLRGGGGGGRSAVKLTRQEKKV
jgi:hypothetical protein